MSLRFERIRDRREFRNGPTVAATSRRLACDDVLLRHLVHLSQGWIPRLESFDVKVLFGIHVNEDAQFVTAIRGRIGELGAEGLLHGRPDSRLRRILDFLDGLKTWPEYAGCVYSIIKPGLIDAWEKHFTTTNHLLDEPTARLFAGLLRVGAEHIGGGMALVESLYHYEGVDVARMRQATTSLRTLWGELSEWFDVVEDSETRDEWSQPWRTFPPIKTVVRDPQPPEPRTGGAEAGMLPRSLHQLLGEELERAEVLAESSHSNPEMPWEFHCDMARLTWDQMRHAVVLEKLISRAGVRWGHLPVRTVLSRELLAMPLGLRMEILAESASTCNREGALCNLQRLEGADDLSPWLVCRYFRADDETFVARCRRWAAHLRQKQV